MVIALLCSLALLAAAETIVSPDEIVSLDDLTFDEPWNGERAGEWWSLHMEASVG